jgi:superfamily II DNA or RNA helicase
MIKLRPYQNELYLDLESKIEEGYKRILIQAETGWGKSILIGHTANNLKGRTLILTHRIELLTQNSEWINDVGILTAKVKKVDSLKKCKNIIAMTQTVSARFDKFGSDYIGSFDNVIVDETHVDFFKKVYKDIDLKLVIGLTATPIVYKTEKKTISEGEVMSRKLSLADDFDVLIQGIGVNDLIDLGYLTEDKYIALTPPNLSKLVKSASNPDGYTSSSLTEVFGSYASINIVLSAYEKRADTKTIIFNPTTKVNLKVYEAFMKAGYDDRVKLFDSVNKDSSETRSDIVKWYKETPNAVLLNVGVFTTGFDVPDIETIIYNKSTLSLSLCLQSWGRGGRVSKGKESFTIIDLGLNIERHGFWSDDRDWKKYFVVHKWEAKTPSDILQVWECKSCGAYNLKGTVFNTESNQFECGECNHPKEDSKSQVKHIKGELVEVKKVRYPSSKSIIDYATSNGNDANLAFRLLEKKIISLFVSYTKKEHYLQNRDRYLLRVIEIYRPVYFSIIRSKLKGANKRLRTQTDKIITKLDKHYDR